MNTFRNGRYKGKIRLTSPMHVKMMMILTLMLIIRVCLLHYLVTPGWGAPTNAESLFAIRSLLYTMYTLYTAKVPLFVD